MIQSGSENVGNIFESERERNNNYQTLLEEDGPVVYGIADSGSGFRSHAPPKEIADPNDKPMFVVFAEEMDHKEKERKEKKLKFGRESVQPVNQANPADYIYEDNGPYYEYDSKLPEDEYYYDYHEGHPDYGLNNDYYSNYDYDSNYEYDLYDTEKPSTTTTEKYVTPEVTNATVSTTTTTTTTTPKPTTTSVPSTYAQTTTTTLPTTTVDIIPVTSETPVQVSQETTTPQVKAKTTLNEEEKVWTIARLRQTSPTPLSVSAKTTSEQPQINNELSLNDINSKPASEILGISTATEISQRSKVCFNGRCYDVES